MKNPRTSAPIRTSSGPTRSAQQPRSLRVLFALSLVAIPVVFGTLTGGNAFAQGKGKPKGKDSDNPYEFALSGSAPQDAGPLKPAPAPVAYVDGGARVSPLTPAISEYPRGDAGFSNAPTDVTLSEIALLRARVAKLSEGVFKSRIVVSVRADSSARLGKVSVSVDDNVLYTSSSTASFSDGTEVLKKAVAPGGHAITVESEWTDPNNERVRGVQKSRYLVEVGQDEEFSATFRLTGESSLGKSSEGSFDLRSRLIAERKRNEKK